MKTGGLLVLLMIIASPVLVHAQPPTPAPAKNDKTALEIRLEALEKQRTIDTSIGQHAETLRKSLSDEASTHRAQMQAQMDTHVEFLESLLNHLKWVVGSVLAFLLGLLTFLGVGSYKELQSKLKSAEERFESLAESKLTAALEHRLKNLQGKVAAIETLLQRESAYRTCRVSVLGPELSAMSNELQLLAAAGLENIGRVNESTEFTTGSEKPALVIIHFPWFKESSDENLPQVLKSLATLRVPVVIYAPGTRVDGEDQVAITKYGLATHANTPLTLATNLYPLAHIGAKLGDTA